MAEEIINALTKLEDLRIVARTSAFQFKGQALDLREVGSKLGDTTVLEGSVRKATHGHYSRAARRERRLVRAVLHEGRAMLVELSSHQE